MLSAVVLSGGLSTRMGEEKGLKHLNGRPLIDYVIAAVRGVADEVIVSVGKGKLAYYRSTLPAECRVVEDRRSGLGPLEGLSTAFSVATGEYVLVAPCDTPFLKPEVCRYVASVAVGSEGAIPIVNGYPEPVHGAYERRSALVAFDAAIAARRLKIVDACARLSLRKVEEPTLRMFDAELLSFWNINTSEELRQAERRVRGD